MNRKDFFKKLGAGAIVVAVAPKVLADIKPGKVGPHGIPFVDVSRIPDGMTLEEVPRIYNETGTLVYQTTTPSDITGRIITMRPSSTPLDTIIKEARRRGYDLSEY